MVFDRVFNSVARDPDLSVIELAHVQEASTGDFGDDPLDESADQIPEGIGAFAGLAVEPKGEDGTAGHVGKAGELAGGGIVSKAAGIFDSNVSGAEGENHPGEDGIGAEAAGFIAPMIGQGQGSNAVPEAEVAGEGINDNSAPMDPDIFRGPEDDIDILIFPCENGRFYEIVFSCFASRTNRLWNFRDAVLEDQWFWGGLLNYDQKAMKWSSAACNGSWRRRNGCRLCLKTPVLKKVATADWQFWSILLKSR